MIALEILGALFTYWIASDILCLLVLRLSGVQERGRSGDVYFLTRGAGPITISWLLFHFVLIIPGQPPSLYVALIAASFGAALYLGRTRLPQLVSIYRGLGRGLARHWPLSRLSAVLATLIAAVALFIASIGVSFPIVEGDALGFAQEARIIHRDLSFENYPTLQADAQTGYHYDTFQVPCLQMLYVWFFLLTQTSEVDILPRTVAPMYAFYTVLVLCWVLYRRTQSIETALWGGLALIAAPLFTTESYYNTQDPHRIYFFFCGLVFLDIVLEAATTGGAVLLGVVVGLGIYSHFSGFMLLPIVLSLYLWFERRTPARAAAGASVIGLLALMVGGTHHYLRPAVAQRVLLQFPAVLPFIAEPLQQLGLADLLPQGTMIVSPQAYDWLASRRGQQGWWAWLIFAKLQLFTGVEFFGALFWFAAVGIVSWIRRPQKARLDIILALGALFCTALVLSDVRKMASSNPRYIGTILPIGAYFAAMAIAAMTSACRRAPAWRRIIGVSLLLVVIVAPVALTSAVRGAKVGLTNPGNVYEIVHSPSFLKDIARHPIRSGIIGWQRYLGIRETAAYFFASDVVKLEHTHDSFAAINYMRTSTPVTAKALVFRVTRYFYYARRRGVAFTDPRMDELTNIATADRACRFLSDLGIDHVLMDSYYSTYPMYADTRLVDVLADPALSTKVYEYGDAQVYRLHCDGTGTEAKR